MTTKALKQVPLIIVAWTGYFGSSLKVPLVPTLADCDYKCLIIERAEQKNYDQKPSAFVLHGRNINDSDLPERNTQQLAVLFLLESPYHAGGGISKVPPNFFNATMTYRRDSRYFYPYGYFPPITARTPANQKITQQMITDAMKRKTRGSLIFVSNCKTPSKREVLIRELGQYTQVTVRGKCQDKLSVSNTTTAANCKVDCDDNGLIATHRFYLSFENSLCNDYITEKFFLRISQMLVPVVMKRKTYEDYGIPPDSFIALSDFNSVAELADYLNYLRDNDQAYLEYFNWTKSYAKPSGYVGNAACRLCEDLHRKERLVVNNIVKYYKDNQC
ncbi:hypothetical protein Q1695_005610 [Nippostrongylus brasiliensis]|nr:hypothetical protein Q1695_005610 [Nippostrongylus brasiliensis]